jgi:hypothetical protein
LKDVRDVEKERCAERWRKRRPPSESSVVVCQRALTLIEANRLISAAATYAYKLALRWQLLTQAEDPDTVDDPD